MICTTLSTALVADEHPQILDFYPDCPPQILATVEDRLTYDIDRKQLKSSGGNILDYRDEYVQQALIEIQNKAKKAGADAVIIEQLRVGAVDRSFSTNSGSRKSKTQKLFVLSKVQQLKLCPTKQLSSKPTPYNSEGKSVSYTETVVSLNLPEDGNILKLARQHQAPEPKISTKGAYGINIGDSIAKLQQALGPHSIQLQLTNGAIVYGYGRHLWFIVKHGKVIAISQDLGLLNGHGQNQIALSDNYDHTHWVIADRIQRGDNLEQVKVHLPIKKVGNSYRVINKETQLLLKFESYKESLDDNNASRLNSFAILPSSQQTLPNKINFAQFDNTLIGEILALDFEQDYLLQPQQLQNQILLDESGPKILVNHNLLLGYDKQKKVNYIKVTESMSSAQTMFEFNQVLAKYNIPSTKSALLARYPQAEDNLDNIMISDGFTTLLIDFDSYEDEAQLIELTLSFE